MSQDKLKGYTHAMTIDNETGKPMPKTATTLMGSYVRESTAPRPEGKEGDTLYLWDTKEAFIHDGTEWRSL